MKISVERNGIISEYGAVEGQSVLDVLRENNVPIRATCGGVGKCRKCQVMVRDAAQGLHFALACTTPVEDGLLVVVEEPTAMDVVDSGVSAVFPADTGQTGFGIAVDIGTTTVAAHLHNLETGERVASVSNANPQIAFGADVISRISASVDGQLDQMYDLIIDEIDRMRTVLCEHAHVRARDVRTFSIAGNTTMQHIACALPPDTIGVNPFTPLTLFGDVHEIEQLGSCYFSPCIAGYVGGDITAGMLARELDNGRCRLFLDLGTNGEMALSHGGTIISCATAAGPVFEGANVHFGMPAGPGAISQVDIADGAPQIEVLGDVEPIGICGTGIIDAIASLVDEGIVDETGYLLGDDEVEGPLSAWLGEEDGLNVFYLTADHSIYITQNDVRSLQLAKAAVCAGIWAMMKTLGVGIDDIESLEIAGGFGRFLDLSSAARVGLFPAELLDRATSVGNTSAEGAAAMLISNAARARAEAIKDESQYLELSTSSLFNDLYVQMMEFE